MRVVRLVEALPNNRTNEVIGRQLLRCGTSAGANYRAACRAKSRPDFIAKMGIVEEDCDESIYWIELLVDTGQIKGALVKDLLHEADEMLAMAIASLKTARSRR